MQQPQQEWDSPSFNGTFLGRWDKLSGQFSRPFLLLPFSNSIDKVQRNSKQRLLKSFKGGGVFLEALWQHSDVKTRVKETIYNIYIILLYSSSDCNYAFPRVSFFRSLLFSKRQKSKLQYVISSELLTKKGFFFSIPKRKGKTCLLLPSHMWPEIKMEEKKKGKEGMFVFRYLFSPFSLPVHHKTFFNRIWGGGERKYKHGREGIQRTERIFSWLVSRLLLLAKNLNFCGKKGKGRTP